MSYPHSRQWRAGRFRNPDGWPERPRFGDFLRWQLGGRPPSDPAFRPPLVQNDGKRVRVLFTPEAREAVEKAKVTPYVETVAASDNLRFALNGASPESDQRPFGRASSGAGNEGAQ